MATSQINEGARMERKAFMARLRRMTKEGYDPATVKDLIEWVQSRKDRYEKKKGGVGRK